MDPGDVVVATMTWARSSAEAVAIERAFQCLVAGRWRVAVADRTGGEFADRLRRLPGVEMTTPSEPGLVAQVQASMHLASSYGTPFILYAESDKEFFFKERLGDFVARAPGGPLVGAVVAARSPDSYQTYPAMQRYTEGVINHLSGMAIGAAGDYSYGPFLLNRRLLPDIARLPAAKGWGWRHATFLAAHRHGLAVLHIEGDYPCPGDQRVEDDEQRCHRLRQLSQNILGLVD